MHISTNMFPLNLDEKLLLDLGLLCSMVFWMVLYKYSCIIMFGDCVYANMSIFDEFVNALLHSFLKEVSLIKEYVLFVPVSPCTLCKPTKIVKL